MVTHRNMPSGGFWHSLCFHMLEGGGGAGRWGEGGRGVSRKAIYADKYGGRQGESNHCSCP